jgi:CRP-like cAMP-binding protein
MHHTCIFWQQLDDQQRALLTDIGRIRDYRPHELIIQGLGDDKNAVVLLRGRVRVMAGTRHGKDAILALRGPGDIVGELPVLDGGPRSATVEAISDVRGLVLDFGAFRSILRLNPQIMSLISAVVAGRLREADRRRAELSTSGVLTRTGSVILDLAGDTRCDNGAPIHLDIGSQVDLAGLVGTSRESIVRALADLRERGVIATARGSITVLDLDRLRAVADL